VKNAAWPAMTDPNAAKMGVWEVTAIGIGGMVGGGIFAVLGLSVALTHGAAPLAFGKYWGRRTILPVPAWSDEFKCV
jgi:hypothetical protein